MSMQLTSHNPKTIIQYTSAAKSV